MVLKPLEVIGHRFKVAQLTGDLDLGRAFMCGAEARRCISFGAALTGPPGRGVTAWEGLLSGFIRFVFGLGPTHGVVRCDVCSVGSPHDPVCCGEGFSALSITCLLLQAVDDGMEEIGSRGILGVDRCGTEGPHPLGGLATG
jgi:hypothetical protein